MREDAGEEQDEDGSAEGGEDEDVHGQDQSSGAS